MFSWIPLFAQFGYTDDELRTVFRNALGTYAENNRLKAEARADSITIVNLTKSLGAERKATEKAQEATDKAVGIGQTWHSEATLKDTELTQAKKEIKKQKFIKWVAIIAIPVVAVGVAIVATKVAND